MAEMHLVPHHTLWNGKNEVRNATNSHGIYPQSKHIDEAWAMCQYLISDDAQFKILENRWSSPMVKRHATSPAWLENLDPNLETAAMWEEAVATVRGFTHVPRMQEIDKLIQAAKDRIILGDASAQESMDEVVAKINTILDEVAVEIKEAGL